MKTLTSIFSLLLFMTTLHSEEVKIYSSMHYYSKPGAPINISYPEIRMELNETADVNLTLTTSINQGTVYVNTVIDKNLKASKEFDTNATFTIQPNQQDFLMNFKVEANKEGLFYIRLLTKVQSQTSKKLRTFAVPIYVGSQEKAVAKSLNGTLKALGTSENISVSKAQETIQVVKEK